MGYLKTLKEASESLRVREPFTTGTLTGSCGTTGNYEVSSYGTLIAIDYYTTEEEPAKLWATDKKYSVTTSKHLNIIKRAWGLN